MKKYLPLLIYVLLSGCISITSLPANSGAPITNICIQKNPKVIVPKFTDALQEALTHHGISSTIYDTVPETCQYYMTYVAYQRWDFVMFMSNAHVDLYKRDKIIGYADRHMPFGSGFDFSKWDATTTKVDEMVDQLLTSNGAAQQIR